MMALTEFGATCRTFRSVRNLIMADQARALRISSAFISAVETGAKAIPSHYVCQVAEWLKLTEAERQELETAARASARVIKVLPKDAERAKVVIELAESIERLKPAQIRQLRAIINKGAQ